MKKISKILAAVAMAAALFSFAACSNASGGSGSGNGSGSGSGSGSSLSSALIGTWKTDEIEMGESSGGSSDGTSYEVTYYGYITITFNSNGTMTTANIISRTEKKGTLPVGYVPQKSTYYKGTYTLSGSKGTFICTSVSEDNKTWKTPDAGNRKTQEMKLTINGKTLTAVPTAAEAELPAYYEIIKQGKPGLTYEDFLGMMGMIYTKQ